VYQTPLLTEPWELAGSISVELFVSSDCLDTDFTAKLCDVYPDGRAMLMTDGIRRARHRLRMDGEDFLIPGEIVSLTIDLPQTAIVFNRGHRIMIAISSSNSPRFDTNPNTGEPFMQHTTTLIAHNTIYHDETHMSRVLLPMTGDLPAAVGGTTATFGAPVVRWRAAPNPFIASTRIEFVLDKPRQIEVFLLDSAGRRVRALRSGPYARGMHTLLWDGTDDAGRVVAAGVYRCLLRDVAEERSGTIMRLR
jgi:hypothetical protein